MASTKNCCVICGKRGNEKFVLFTQQSLKKCQTALALRHAHKLKYHGLHLPIAVDEISGYHSGCYKSFTAVAKKYSDQSASILLSSESGNSSQEIPNDCILQQPTTSLEEIRNECTLQKSSTSSEKIPAPESPQDMSNCYGPQQQSKVCIFCGKDRKTHKAKFQKLCTGEKTSLHVVKEYAFENNDLEMLKKIDEYTTSSKVVYHAICKSAYYNQYKSSVRSNKNTIWHTARENHKRAFDKLHYYIENEIVQGGNIIFLSSLFTVYTEILTEIFGENVENNEDLSFSEQHLEQKIRSKFRDQVKIITMHHRKIVVAAKGIDSQIGELIFASLEEEDVLRKAALILRRDLLNIKKDELSENLTSEDLVKGECSTPQSLHEFYTTVIGGLDCRLRNNPGHLRKVNSFCQDLIYAVSNGKIKTSKHMTLGITLKSLTSSKKVIDILNRYGHCCPYNVIEELETELTYAATEESQLSPAGISLASHLSTGVAFHNFDRFVETINGEDTLHDTVGIIFQFEELNNNQSEKPSSDGNGTAPDDETHDVDDDLRVGRTGNEDEEVRERDIYEVVDDSRMGKPGKENENSLPSRNDDVFVESRVRPSSNPSIDTRRRKRRTFDAIVPDIPAYPKKLRMMESLLSMNYGMRENIPEHLAVPAQVDLLWMFSHALKIPNSPMWVGFNSKLYRNNGPKQKVLYLPPINLSPTDTSVVRKTLFDSIKIANECSQRYIQVTYDLAICKIAHQIQSMEAPRFANVFIHLGQFHIMMAFFKAVGKVIDNCGLSHIMIESDLIASESVNGFISGKHFNQCKRLHPMVSLGLQILHFEAFLEQENVEVSDEVVLGLKNIQQTGNITDNINESLSTLLAQYAKYRKRTLAGEFGKTPQFYLIYINLINYYQLLSKSIRTSDFELYKYILPKMSNLLFILNQPNYARWLVKYHDNLLKVDDTHPGLIDEFKKGSFGVKRTEKPFSRQPIDLTLKQTINADAGRKLTGISHFTNSISARQRWAKSHGIRSTILSHVYAEIGLTKFQDVDADLEPNKMKKHVAGVEKFMDIIKQNMNPFSIDIQRSLLFNIGTGKAAQESTANFLLNIEVNGNRLRESFISECSRDPMRFEKVIEKQIIANFSSETVKRKIKVGNKVQEIRMQRDLFGRILRISMEKDVDLEKVMTYPVTPVPMSMCHPDGKIYKTTKSSLMKILEQRIETLEPPSFDAIILDGFFMLHLLRDVPKSFGSISKKILQIVTRYSAQRIDIVFDQYFSPSIKDNDRHVREGFQSSTYKIGGPDQVRPANFATELRNSSFKEALVGFLIDHWASDEMASYIGDKNIYLNHKECYRYHVCDEKVIRNLEIRLNCPNHEEANTKIVYHLSKMFSSSNILIKCSDTDILIILLGNITRMSSIHEIWVQAGTGNSSRYIDVKKLHNALGDSLCDALPGFHAFTGCGYNPAFFGKGKEKPLKILEKSAEYKSAFSSLRGTSSTLFPTTFNIIEKFVCEMYGTKKIHRVDKTRFHLFLTNYKPTDDKEEFKKKLRNYDASNLPPCEAELHQHFLRTRYITSIWSNADLQIPSTLKANENGWSEEDGKYEFVWFEGDQLPAFTNEVTIEPYECVDADKTPDGSPYSWDDEGHDTTDIDSDMEDLC